MTLRGRLVALVVLVTLVSLGGAFAAVAASVNHAQLVQLDDAIVSEAHDEAALASVDEKVPERSVPAPDEHGPLPHLVALYGADGAVLDASRTFVSSPPPLALLPRPSGRTFDVALCGDPMRAVLVTVPGRPGALLLFAAPRRDVDRDARFLARAMLVAFFVAVAWAGLVASWVVRRLTRDNETIAGVVRRVAAGDLSARVGRGSHASDHETARLASDVDEMVARLQVLVDSQRRFIANAAHELRSPLTSLYGELQLALRKRRDASEYREAIAHALQSTQHLRALSEDLLALARAGAEDAADHTHVALGDVARAAAATLRAPADDLDVTIEIEVEEEAMAMGRARDLERMLRNLVENAIRHSPRGARVRVSSNVRGSMIEVSVEDEGEGVPEDSRERIFEPFFRLPRDRSGDAPGAGLGLATAREIARAHGGDVRIVEGAKGARFVVHLPRATATS